MKYRIVPWVTVWSDELVPTETRWLKPGRDMLRCGDRRDQNYFMGVLWQPDLNQQGMGHPIFGLSHTGRQRQAMLQLRCQVCGKLITDRRLTWLMPEAEWGGEFQQRRLTNTPPTCRACQSAAGRLCPRLRNDGYVRFTAAAAKPWGVVGDLYHPALRTRDLWVPFGHRALAHLVARQIVVNLDDVRSGSRRDVERQPLTEMQRRRRRHRTWRQDLLNSDVDQRGRR